MTDLTTERPTEDRQRYEHPGESQTGLPGVPLARLVSLARLTPAQALEISAGLLEEAAKRWEPRAGGDHVQVDRFVVGVDGRVALAPSPDGNPGPSVEAVLADVVAAARLSTRRADPTAEQLLGALGRASADLPIEGVPVVARRLRDAADAIDGAAVRAELAALVTALGGGAGSAGGAGAIGTAGARAVPAGRTTRGSGSAARRVGAWLASVLVLGAVVLLEVVLLRDDISTDIDVLLEAGRSGAESSTAPTADGLTIRVSAPAAAGNVTGVDLRAVGACRPGAPCTLRLQVGLVPAAQKQVVTWSYLVVDGCTGAVTAAPGGTVTVPARGERVAAVGTVSLPKLRAVGVVAVTRSPATTASAPLIVGSCLPDRRAE